MRRSILCALALVGALVPSADASAQQWRRLETARQLTDSSPMKLDVSFGPGRFKLYPITGKLLYQMQMHYDESAADARHRYNAEDRRLVLGVERGNVSWKAVRSGGDHNPSTMELGFNAAVPIALDVKLAAIQNGRIDLGGFKITRLEVNAAATELKLDFSAPNPIEMTHMLIEVGAAGAEVTGLGNANVTSVRIKGAAGAVGLDLGSSFGRDIAIESDLALGALHLRIPDDVGVRVDATQFMGKMELEGLTKKDGTWYSDNWMQSSRKVTINSRVVLGALKIERTAR